MASSSRSGSLADHKEEEEESKKLEKKQFPSQTRFYDPNKKATIYYDSLNGTSNFSDQTERHVHLNGTFLLKPEDENRINFTFKSERWSIYGFMPKYLSQGRVISNILFEAKIRFEIAGWKFLPRTIYIDCWPLVVFDNNQNPRNPTFKPTVRKVDY
ncbi:uncharacterized protein LOC132799785 [Ziziphus jujuba]|uniref:Uncharacterized protein LOC132799784 n=1 Tax=Ziziphus jujuba TaxID=326968 RepID=A0ABM3ZVB7_ZIZJJ|nr:uncharacterized protein LOC132799784 [Ziziphus jujuba]XP_060668430.1 uncharacterized protein LOC132799785 [Ziziphus jujuba]